MSSPPAPAIVERGPDAAFGPWNPGIGSEIPRALRPLTTVFRPENSYTSFEKAQELCELTGLPLIDLVCFRPRRLALHELLIRVSANLSVNDGPRVEDLGISFRRMTGVLLERDVDPVLPAIEAGYERMRERIAAAAASKLQAALRASGAHPAAPPARRPGLMAWLNGAARGARRNGANAGDERAAANVVDALAAQAAQSTGACEQAALEALMRVTGALLARHGRLWATAELITGIATDLACNALGAAEIGAVLEPLILRGARREGYALLPPQRHPVVMNTKGASASGKSSMRPLQHALANRIGVRWGDFALISPDIWRKQLLDYASLGPHYKYAGALTGEELQIVDHKLDRYMAVKAERGLMSHLLIDRFRFDSFAPASDRAGSNLLSRFGEDIHLFFMITPPEATVERAWARGLEVGRYKAVDDLLAHNVEAYSGMPEVFFTWALDTSKRVRYEFLDNSVAQGERPRTAAFGANGRLYVLDLACMLNVSRYRLLNVAATAPGCLYIDPACADLASHTEFIRDCVRRLGTVCFAERDSGRIYLEMRAGLPVWHDSAVLRGLITDPLARAAIAAVAPSLLGRLGAPPAAIRLIGEEIGADASHLLGRWCADAA